MKGADSTMTKQLTTINPATEEVINTYNVASNQCNISPNVLGCYLKVYLIHLTAMFFKES